jgi:hypothetical protein
MITTRLTSRFDLSVPIVLAPMDRIADARLATAVTRSGGLGVLGVGYGDADWLNAQLAEAGETRIGVGFITWKLAERPELLDLALARNPSAVMLLTFLEGCLGPSALGSNHPGTSGMAVMLVLLFMAEGDWPPGVPRRLDR